MINYYKKLERKLASSYYLFTFLPTPSGMDIMVQEQIVRVTDGTFDTWEHCIIHIPTLNSPTAHMFFVEIDKVFEREIRKNDILSEAYKYHISHLFTDACKELVYEGWRENLKILGM